MSRTVRRGYIGHSHIIRDKVYKVYGSNKPKISDFTRHYQCQNEFCAEIRDMQCDRNCHGVQFKTGKAMSSSKLLAQFYQYSHLINSIT